MSAGLTKRYVNHLDAEDFEKKETRNLLKALSGSLLFDLADGRIERT